MNLSQGGIAEVSSSFDLSYNYIKEPITLIFQLLFAFPVLCIMQLLIAVGSSKGFFFNLFQIVC